MRAAVRSILLLLLFAVLGPIHVATKLIFRRSGWPRRFLAAAAWVVGARPVVRGQPLVGRTLLISDFKMLGPIQGPGGVYAVDLGVCGGALR